MGAPVSAFLAQLLRRHREDLECIDDPGRLMGDAAAIGPRRHAHFAAAGGPEADEFVPARSHDKGRILPPLLAGHDPGSAVVKL